MGLFDKLGFNKLKEGLNCYLVQEEHLILSIFSIWVDLDIFTMTHKEALVKYISKVLNTYKIGQNILQKRKLKPWFIWDLTN